MIPKQESLNDWDQTSQDLQPLDEPYQRSFIKSLSVFGFYFLNYV